MKHLLIILIISGIGGDISQINKHKREANAAIQAKDYTKALTSLQALVHDLQANEPQILLNLANCFDQLKTENKAYQDSAQAYYRDIVARDAQQNEKSEAYTQLGIYQAANSQKADQLAEALQLFKKAIKQNPANQEARYNYELVKKLMEQKQKEEEKKDQNKDQNQKDQQKKEQQQKEKDQQQDQQEKQSDQNQQKEQQDKEGKEGKEGEEEQKDQQQKQENDPQKEGEKSDQQKEKEGEKGEKTQEKEAQKGEQEQSAQEKAEAQRQAAEQQKQQRLEKINISEEKMKEIMEAYRANEVQFFQQQRKMESKKDQQNRDKSKPDW